MLLLLLSSEVALLLLCLDGFFASSSSCCTLKLSSSSWSVCVCVCVWSLQSQSGLFTTTIQHLSPFASAAAFLVFCPWQQSHVVGCSLLRPLSQWQPSSLVTFHTRSELTVAVVTWQQLLHSTLSAQLGPGRPQIKKISWFLW